MEVREMKQEDLQACAQILCRVYNNELWMCRWEQETAVSYLADFFEMKKFVGFVLCDEQQVIGAILAHEKIWWNNSEIFVEEMFITPERQRQGLGSLLLQRMEAYIREKGLAGMTLSTNKYAPAPKFYEKNGFFACEHIMFMAKELD